MPDTISTSLTPGTNPVAPTPAQEADKQYLVIGLQDEIVGTVRPIRLKLTPGAAAEIRAELAALDAADSHPGNGRFDVDGRIVQRVMFAKLTDLYTIFAEVDSAEQLGG